MLGKRTGAFQSSEKQETVVAAPSDEDLIRADIESIVGTSVSKEALAASFRTDSQMVEFEKIGMDIDAYAEAFSKKCKLEIDFIEVKSDTAVAKVTFTTPRLDDEAEKLLDETLDTELENVNIENATLRGHAENDREPRLPPGKREFRHRVHEDERDMEHGRSELRRKQLRRGGGQRRKRVALVGSEQLYIPKKRLSLATPASSIS